MCTTVTAGLGQDDYEIVSLTIKSGSIIWALNADVTKPMMSVLDDAAFIALTCELTMYELSYF